MRTRTRDTATPSANRRQLRDEVVTYVRELIVSGRQQPNSWLPLEPLAEKLQISVTPVREALLLLAQEGWVVQELNRGFRVAPLRANDVEDAYLVHSFVSGELAARAAKRITDEQIGELRALDREIRNRPGSAQTSRLNALLHDRINEIAGSPRLVWFVASATRFVPRRFLPSIPGWREINRHDDVIDALEARDPELCRKVTSAHVLRACKVVVDHLKAAGAFTENDAQQQPKSNYRRRKPVARRERAVEA